MQAKNRKEESRGLKKLGGRRFTPKSEGIGYLVFLGGED
jgi:hypothetical protein